MISLESKTQSTTSSSPLSIAPSEEGESNGLSFSELLRGASSSKNGKIVQKESLSSLGLSSEELKGLSSQELQLLIGDAKNYLKDKIVSSEGFKKSEIAALPQTLKGLTQVAQKLGIDMSKITLQEVRSEVKQESKFTLNTDKVNDDTDFLDTKQISSKSTNAEEIVQTQVAKSTKKGTSLQVNKEIEAIEQRVDKKVVDAPKEIKTTPLFKAQATQEITTEQFVNAKMTTVEVKTPKQKADDTLKMLIRGDKISQKESTFTADFSVATARVIAPQATTDASKSLESLLRGDSTDNANIAKIDGLSIPKADSFEVKLNEAKQMTKYLSQDVKTAIEDYKSPFTRIKVQLNPQRLGEIDLTIVQRGKNLHINLSSNNAAINTLALNANDLKAQLTNNGINNASLNFNNNSQGSESGFSGQQQQSQNRQEAQQEYNYFDNEEKNEEILNSLEIVVPNYA